MLQVLQSENYLYLIFEYCALGTIKEHMVKMAGYRQNEIAYIIK